MENGYVKYQVEDNIAKITFFHPKSNSLPSNILQELAVAITRAGEDENAKVILIKSDGERAFCAGASFDELISITEFSKGRMFFMGFAGVINAIRKAPKFVICRVQGRAVGGGVGLVAACDYAIASEDASVKLSEYALGIGPFVVGPAVERKIGKSAFMQMTIDCDWYDSQWAVNNGLFVESYINIEDLDYAVDQLATKLASASPSATAELKKVFWEGTENWDQLLQHRAEISGKLVLSDFTKDYIKQFLG
jgi:methylglutaconyl-CoA hydratase